MQKLLIADCNEDYREALTAALQDSYQITCCRTGTAAWTLLHQEQPDILVLDLMLPELDGLTLLERACNEGQLPPVLALTPLLSDYVYGCIRRLGIEYVVLKPCDIQAIASRVKDLSRKTPSRPPKADPGSYTAGVLLSLGFSTKHNGYSYLRESVLLMAKDPGQSVTKVIYPTVGHRFGCSKENVERSIRTAMDHAWRRGDAACWNRYFPDAPQRPSNAVFITRMAQALLMEE